MYHTMKDKKRLWHKIGVRKLFFRSDQSMPSFPERPVYIEQNTIVLLLLALGLFISSPAVFAQLDMAPGATSEKTDSQVALDPLEEQMVPGEIQARLLASREKVDTARDKPTRSQWIHVKQLLQMQLERLDALEDDFSLEAIEYPPDVPPFPLSYLDQTRHKYRELKETHLQLEKAHYASENRIEVAEKTYLSTRQQLNTLGEEGGTAEQKEKAELGFQLGKESLIYARLDARLINQRLKQASNNLLHVGEAIPVIEKDVLFSGQDYKLQLDSWYW